MSKVDAAKALAYRRRSELEAATNRLVAAIKDLNAATTPADLGRFLLAHANAVTEHAVALQRANEAYFDVSEEKMVVVSEVFENLAAAGRRRW